MTTAFIEDATQNRIADLLAETFYDRYRYRPSRSEIASWRNSLRAMANVISAANLLDHGVLLEWQLPLTSRRLDVFLTGHNHDNQPSSVIVELKQWENAEATSIPETVLTFVGGRPREMLHPSAQVGGYREYLRDTHSAFTDGRIVLKACSFLHNMSHDPEAEIYSDRHRNLLSMYPAFAGDQVDDLATYLNDYIGAGGGHSVLKTVVEGRYAPHKRLLDHTAKMINNEPTYVLLDEQRVVFNSILAHVDSAKDQDTKTVFVIKGGPGTGKSVIALNLVAELAAAGHVVHHATGSRAFTENVRRAVGPRAKALFNYFNSYSGQDPETLDIVVLDEAHRIRETSNNRFTKKADRSDRPQVEELIEIARVSVFFLDDLQVVRPAEIGSIDLIKATARTLEAEVKEYELEAQFRCGGSDAFIEWVDNTLELRRTPTVLWDAAEEFDFDIIDTPEELEAIIRSKAKNGSSARLVAGFCWPWSKPLPDGTLVNDVSVNGWTMPWNARPEATGLAAGIPKSNFWASDPGGLDQVGCVYTAQGFEFDYAGLVFGRDLVYRAREGWIGQPEYSHDSVVRRAQKDPGRFVELVKQTYRVLLTRGLKGCYVYFEDEATRDFVLSRTDRLRRTTREIIAAVAEETVEAPSVVAVAPQPEEVETNG